MKIHGWSSQLLDNTYVVKVGLMSYKHAPMIGIHVPSFLPRKF
jgi:hypothetical protein